MIEEKNTIKQSDTQKSNHDIDDFIFGGEDYAPSEK